MDSRKVSLEEMLAARDRRAEAQREMLASWGSVHKGHKEIDEVANGMQDEVCLISLTLNIPGDVKRTPMTKMLFDRGMEELYRFIGDAESDCSGIGDSPVVIEYSSGEIEHNSGKIEKNLRILDKRIIDEKTGSEALLLIGRKSDSCGLSKKIKALLEGVEDSFPAARLFDFDVIDSTGEKLSRMVPRRCLICDEPAHACARSRAHGLETVQEKVKELLTDFCASKLGEMGRDALILEIHTTPKPGLVDENNNGAHQDMDIPLFERSIDAISQYLKEAAMLGIKSVDEVQICDLKKYGIIAEEKMFRATGGVNTHKGIIYSMGLILFGMGRALATGGDPLEIASNLAKEDAEDRLSKALINQQSNGSKVYSSYGAKGAVGEAVFGFPMAKLCRDRLSFYYKKIYKRDYGDETKCSHEEPDYYKLKIAGTFALVDVMSVMEDTNILHRGGKEGLEFTQREACRISELILTCLNDSESKMDNGIEEGNRFVASESDIVTKLTNEIKGFDVELINRNLSPGGCADMLALGYLLMLWDTRVNKGVKGETV